MTVHVKRYAATDQDQWNQFVAQSKNATFLFNRVYMDYHSDRFTDHSLLIYNGNNLIGLFPANQRENTLFSHQGLTFGGLLSNKEMRASLALEIFQTIQNYLFCANINRVVYKAIPHIYHLYPSEEDLYALFRFGAKVIRTDLTTSIALPKRWPLHQSKKSGINRAKRAEIYLKESNDFAAFFNLVEARLAERYSTTPVHNAAEMSLLASRFPNSIKLYCAYKGDELLAGTIVYLSNNVVHTQYIASNQIGREVRAVDFLIGQLINIYAAEYQYFDFGISNENDGLILNTNLISQKEEFGGRSIAHQTYEWSLIR